jgi:hypothetical protein
MCIIDRPQPVWRTIEDGNQQWRSPHMCIIGSKSVYHQTPYLRKRVLWLDILATRLTNRHLTARQPTSKPQICNGLPAIWAHGAAALSVVPLNFDRVLILSRTQSARARFIPSERLSCSIERTHPARVTLTQFERHSLSLE